MTDNERNDKPTRFTVVLEPDDMSLLLALQANVQSKLNKRVSSGEIVRIAIREFARSECI